MFVHRIRVVPEVRISRQLSTDSMSSLASMTSMSSFGSAVTDSEVTEAKKNGKKKKHWVRSKFNCWQGGGSRVAKGDGCT